MIIQKITIQNYSCYYGKNVFDIDPGLNIILGENGEGKTKFYEAIDWLFHGNESNLKNIISRKAESELGEGDALLIKVQMDISSLDPMGLKENMTIERSFTATRENKAIRLGRVILKGIVLNSRGEREQVNGESLLDRIFKPEIRKYTMFKGESELNIFENDTALMNLINEFSEARNYQAYTEIGEYLAKRAQSEVDKASARNSKNERDLKTIESNLEKLRRDLGHNKTQRKYAIDELVSLEKNIKEANKYVQNAEELETINERIDKLQKEIGDLKAGLHDNYTQALFDDQWIIYQFKDIQNEFSKKVKDWSIIKRKLQQEFDREVGKRNATLDLINGNIPLPVTTPSREHMEEMISDKICKVCNRAFEEDDETMVFMKARLKEYLIHIGEIETEKMTQQELFENDYLRELELLSSNFLDEQNKSAQIEKEIQDLFELNSEKRTLIQNLENKLELELKKRSAIIGSSRLGEEKLGMVLSDYNNWIKDERNIKLDKEKLDLNIKNIEAEIKLAEESKEKLAQGNVSEFLLIARNLLQDISKIFEDTESRKLEEFIKLLENKSNEIFSNINIDAFTGRIKFQLIENYGSPKIKVHLLEENDREFAANQSLETSMHMAILMAINTLTKERQSASYPLIFDAPTSSFGETKTTQFLNLLSESKNQIIILLKDYLVRAGKGQLQVKAEFDEVKRDRAFWVKLERPFDPEQLQTINTNVVNI